MTRVWPALLLAFCCAAARAESTEGWPLRPEESVRIERAHAEACARVSAVLDRVAARRKAYAGAPDPDEALRLWAGEFGPGRDDVELIGRLKDEHKARTNATEAYLVVRAMNKATSGGRISGRVAPELTGIQNRNETLQMRDGKVHYRYWDEGDAYKDAAAERGRRLEHDAHDRAVVRGFAAGAVALLALAALAAWRHGRSVPEAVYLTAPADGAAPPPQTVPALVGGNIDVVRPLGRGGMGEVYEGLDRTLRRRVALKRLRPELTGSPADLSRLLNEARLVAALKHPNIVSIHSVEKEAGQVFLVFEYVDGPTLAALLSQRRRLPWPEALRIFSAAAGALDAAHRRNIVHRDLKPGNIMLDAKGVVKVMDFGIAYEAAQAVSRLTRSGAWGTPPYMSPEQELGELNAGADLFALNVVLYEMLTGELPFTGPNFLAQKRERVYAPVTAAAPDAPKALDAFFATAFCPDPAGRFRDAAALAAAANALA